MSDTRASATAERTNRYAGACRLCGKRVPAETGRLIRADGQWAVEHTACPEPGTGGHRLPETALDLRSLPAGRYAVPGGDTRLKVQVDKPEEGKWAGWVFVKDAAEYGYAKRYGRQKPGALYVGDIADELAAIVADPQAAAAEYGHLTSTCGICGRPLENETSVERGIGPICAARYGWV